LTVDGKAAPRIRLDAADRRTRMIAAAMSVFAKKPFDQVSTAELAAAAGTTRTNLNYHFGDKRGLYLAVMREFATLRLPENEYGSTIATRVDRLFADWLDLAEANRETFMALRRAGAHTHDEEIAELLQRGSRAWVDRLMSMLGMPESDHAARARLRAFQSLVSTATEEWLEARTLSKDDVRSLMTETLLAISELSTGKSTIRRDRTSPGGL